MRRKAHNRLWTLILMLALCGAGTMPVARTVWASTAPTDAPPPGSPPIPGAGDPDEPGGKSLPKPGSAHGVVQVGRSDSSLRQDMVSIWMLRIRMAFAFAYRFLFRI